MAEREQDVQKGHPARPQRTKGRGVPLWYVEALSDVRIKLGAFFNILLVHSTDRSTEEATMGQLKGTKSHENLKQAFAGESQANRRYLYFARRADIEGYPDVGGLFRDTSEAETGHAFGHLDFLKEVGDPATGIPIGNTEMNLKSAIEGETYEYTQMYPGMAKTARDEGFVELAEWFETLAKAERSHANRFTKGLDSLKQV
jgi:rubrerythrin